MEHSYHKKNQRSVILTLFVLFSFLNSRDSFAQTDFLAAPEPMQQDTINDELRDRYDEDDGGLSYGNKHLSTLYSMEKFDPEYAKKSAAKSAAKSLTKQQTDDILNNLTRNASGPAKKALQVGTGIGTLVTGLTNKPVSGVLKNVDNAALIELTKASVNIIFKDFFDPGDGLVPAVKTTVVKSVLDWALIDQNKPKKPSFWERTKTIAKKGVSVATNALFEIGSTVAKKTVSSSIQIFNETGKGWSKLFIDAAIAFAVMSIKAAIIAAIAI